MCDETRPETLRRVANERNYYRRGLQAMTKGLPKLEWAGEVCGRMNWANPEDAIRHARHATFGGLYDGLPLCELEEAMAVKKHNSLIVLCGYEVVAPVIARQLSAIVRARAEARGCVARPPNPREGEL
jgi:hypothetical protein